ncbi:PAS domain-containing protein [Streptomyces mirabilis]|uniref:PAS domain-containing protein n=1 Tax=Streptomyces mirabilis TaxID=68239 RepID=UPI0033B9A6BC
MTSTDRLTLGKRSNTREVSESAVAMLDERGTVFAWTQAAEQLLGYSAGDVVGRSAALVLPSSGETPTISAFIEQWRAHNDWSGTMTVRHRDRPHARHQPSDLDGVGAGRNIPVACVRHRHRHALPGSEKRIGAGVASHPCADRHHRS